MFGSVLPSAGIGLLCHLTRVLWQSCWAIPLFDLLLVELISVGLTSSLVPFWVVILVYIRYGFTSSLTCNKKVPLKDPITKIHCYIHYTLSVLFSSLPPGNLLFRICNKILYFHINFVIKVQINFWSFAYLELVLLCLLIYFYTYLSVIHCLAIHAQQLYFFSLDFLTMLVHCMTLQRICISTQYHFHLCLLAYFHLWYA